VSEVLRSLRSYTRFLAYLCAFLLASFRLRLVGRNDGNSDLDCFNFDYQSKFRAYPKSLVLVNKIAAPRTLRWEWCC